MPLRIETHAILDSTQDLMREKLERGEDVHGLVIRALEQSKGRGQRRRDWQSSLGGSYQTLAVKDEAGSLKQASAAIAIAIGLAQIMPQYGIKVGIKWPNDLYYPFTSDKLGKKVAGILCEYTQGHFLIAVGMNVNNDIPETATALRGLETESVSTIVLAGMQKGLELLVSNPDLSALYDAYDVLKGRTLSLAIDQSTLQGIAQGINAQGCLQIQSKDKLELICHNSARSAIKIID